jgi:hypothetical protein
MKPTVNYSGEATFHEHADGQIYAMVYAIDHPIWGERIVRTSVLVSEPNPNGFETLNTIYVREDA